MGLGLGRVGQQVAAEPERRRDRDQEGEQDG
jgi:hypothetical protein